MNNLKISIIVPVYNVEPYIRECFDSIAAQTYKGELECIFVDDCGQDKSVEILEGLMAAYQGVIDFSLIHHEHNKGLSGARNTGIRNATGEYLYFLDSDDTITPDCIEKLVALAEKYPGVEVVQGSTKSKQSWLQLRGKNLPEYSSNFKWIKRNTLKRIFIPMTAWNKLIKRTFVLNHQLLFKQGLIHEDEVWNFMLSKYVTKIAFCMDNTYIYRENPNGIMNSTQNSLDSYRKILRFMMHNISGPFINYELECIWSIGTNRGDLLNEVVLGTPHTKLFRVIFNLKDKVCTHDLFSPKGFCYRVMYHVLMFYIKKLY